MSFVHLRVRSEHSIGASVFKPEEIARHAQQLGMPAIGLADVGTLCGAFGFWHEAVGLGLRPIVGVEVPFRDGRVLFYARNRDGWHDLARLVTHAVGRDQRTAVIANHGSNLVAVDCPGDGLVARALEGEGFDSAVHAALLLDRAMYPAGCFLGIGGEGPSGASALDLEMRKIALAVNLELALVLPVGRPDRLISGAEATAAYPGFEDAVENTARIAELCGESFTIVGPLEPFPWPRTYPELRDLAEDTAEQLFAQSVEDCLAARLAQLRGAGAEPDEEAYRARLDYELQIVGERRLEPIFANAARVAAICRARGIAMEPGHGNMPSSLLLFALGVTEIDPIAQDLAFERFLDPNRLRLPEIVFAAEPRRARELLAQISEGFPEICAMSATRAVRNPKTGLVERHIASPNHLVVCGTGVFPRVPALLDDDAVRHVRADVLEEDAEVFGLWTVEVVVGGSLSGR